MLVTQAQLERHLQVTFGTDPDPVIAEYLGQAQAVAERYCRQPLEHATVVETFEAEQSRQTYHVLERFPVTAVASVVENSDPLTVTDEYRWYEDGRLRRISGSYDGAWTTIPGGVVVTYDAGYGTGAPAAYDPAPADLVLGIILIAADLFRNGAAFAKDGAVPVTTVTLDGSDSISYATDAASVASGYLVSDSARALLAPYARRTL